MGCAASSKAWQSMAGAGAPAERVPEGPALNELLQRYYAGNCADHLELFKLFDRSQRGKINWEDYTRALPMLGVKESLDVFKAADANRDGYVDYEEFGAMLRAGTCFGLGTVLKVESEAPAFDVQAMVQAEVIGMPSPLTLYETCDLLRAQLGLAQAPIKQTLAAACDALGVPQDGGLQEQADRCRAALGK